MRMNAMQIKGHPALHTDRNRAWPQTTFKWDTCISIIPDLKPEISQNHCQTHRP